MQGTKSFAGALAVAGASLLVALTLTAGAQAKKPHKAAAATSSSGSVAAGKKLAQDKGCVACHAFKAGETKGAPPLTHIGSNKKWPATKLAAMIRDPKKAAHTDKMPAYGPDKLTDKELKDVVAYLQSLK